MSQSNLVEVMSEEINTQTQELISSKHVAAYLRHATDDNGKLLFIEFMTQEELGIEHVEGQDLDSEYAYQEFRVEIQENNDVLVFSVPSDELYICEEVTPVFDGSEILAAYVALPEREKPHNCYEEYLEVLAQEEEAI